ncbi:MAG: MATE family efflux transporter [Dehalococcoidales bacterium]|nr:MATE family efflux transporter [Dehalococcoidales bacterium]
MAKYIHNPNVLDTEHIGRLLVKLATPAFFGMFVQTLYNVINTIFMGQFVGGDAIAGLTVVFPLQMLAWGIGMMVGMGGSSLISRSIGSGKTDDAEKTVGNGISLGFLIATAVMVMVLPFTDFWLRLIGASDAVLPYASPYLIIIMSANIFNVLAMSLLNFSRAEGNARVGMVAMIIGAVLSIILDAIFIIPLKMGVVGAGLATIISQIVSMAYLFSYYLSGNSYLKIRWHNLRLDFSIVKQMLAIGVGSFVQTVAGSISAMLLIRLVVNYGGDVALGAYGIIQRVMMFATMPAMVFGQGLQPILGFNYGAKRYHLAIKAVKIAVMVSTSISLLAFAVLYLIPEPIMRIFTNDQALIDSGIHISRLIFFSLPFMGTVMVGQTIFQAIGKALQTFILAIVRPVVFLIPLVFLFSHFWQINGVFLAYPVSDMFTLLLSFLLAVPVYRQFRRAITEQQAEAAPSYQPVNSAEIHSTIK